MLNTTYSSELYPTKIRNAAVGLVSASGRMLGVGLMLLAPAVYGKFGFVGVYSFIGGVLLFCALVVGIYGIRTSGVSLEDITADNAEKITA